jgi:hypothetical protein
MRPGLTFRGLNVSQIHDADNTVFALGYGGHLLTSDQWAPLSAAFG